MIDKAAEEFKLSEVDADEQEAMFLDDLNSLEEKATTSGMCVEAQATYVEQCYALGRGFSFGPWHTFGADDVDAGRVFEDLGTLAIRSFLAATQAGDVGFITLKMEVLSPKAGVLVFTWLLPSGSTVCERIRFSLR